MKIIEVRSCWECPYHIEGCAYCVKGHLVTSSYAIIKKRMISSTCTLKNAPNKRPVNHKTENEDNFLTINIYKEIRGACINDESAHWAIEKAVKVMKEKMKHL